MTSLRHIWSIALLLVVSSGMAQDGITLSPLWSLNTPADEIMCTMIDESIVVASNYNDVIIDDIHRDKNHFTLYQGSEVGPYDYSLSDDFLMKRVFEDVGTAFFDTVSNALWFSTAYNFNNEKGATLKIYSIKKTKRGWARPRSFSLNNSQYSVAHPWMNADGTQLFFSSDMKGGSGGMDIWFCNKIGKNKWSDPIWAGEAINSAANELFPTWNKGDIYFSSDRSPENGLDIYRALVASQWEKIEKLRNPFNSVGDDFQLIFKDEESGFLTSNRAFGIGGDDIYHFKINRRALNADEFSFQLLFKDSPLQGVEMLITDENDIMLSALNTDEEGVCSLEGLDLSTMQKIYVLDVPDQYLKDCILYLLDGKGKRIRSYRFGDEGFFRFEYLPLDMLGEAPKLDEADHSLLTLMMSGQVYDKKPGDIGANKTVYITDTQGNLLALAYTTNEGRFHVNELEPLKNYQFMIDPKENANHLHIDLGNSSDDLILENGRAHYRRLDDENSIRLIDENKRPIYINKDEVFIIKNIYYRFESADLNNVAKEQLDLLAIVMRNNPRIRIELSSHTDSRGTSSFNLNLSNQRASNAIAYLKNQGISEKRMVGLGHGEYKLVNACADEVDCSEEDHAVNRRTEIRIYVD